MGSNPNGPRDPGPDRAMIDTQVSGVRETWVRLEISWTRGGFNIDISSQ